MEPQSGIKTWQWVVTAIVIIIVIIIGILVWGNNDEIDVLTPANNTTSGQQTAGAVNRIVMTDQYPGNVVYLSSIQLANPGFVVIHKDSSGRPGLAIGSAYFSSGINPGRVTLSEAMIDGQTYYAVLHSDNGDKVFNASQDAEVKDSNGNTIMRVFKATTSAANEIKG